MKIRPIAPSDLASVVALSLEAWAPVFGSFEAVLGGEIYRMLFPDWQRSQADAVRTACTDSDMEAYVAEREGSVAGFTAVKMNRESGEGEIYMIAVDPAYQRAGIGTALTEFALERMRTTGMRRAKVGTGGDPGHAPARATYEKAGFRPFPLVDYYRTI